MKKWLADFPTTTALVATGIAMALGTAIRYWASMTWLPSGEWLMFVCGFAGVATTHFTVKRSTDHQYQQEKADNAA